MKFTTRILNQAKYQKKYVEYRNYPEIDFKTDKRSGGVAYDMANQTGGTEGMGDMEENNPQKKLHHLFDFYHPQMQNRTVSCLDWNPANTDLLAATYGEYELTPIGKDLDKLQGMLAFWTLKNPEFPERIIKTSSRAISCKFSPRNPNLIGVGMYDGVVAIYDIRKKGDQPIADSKELDTKHLDAVWEVDWVGKGSGNDKREGLISISSDGKIIEWSIKKGLESQELKVLNRVTNPNPVPSTLKTDKSDTINFRYTAGFSFNFLPGDNSTYFTSTEDGTIHHCSKTYKDQYYNNYFGHTGPVYKVRVNPFWTDVFLSCSADWSCRIWNWREDQSKYTLRNLDLFDEVFDIEWSPYCSTLFASTAKDGRLELWDLQKKSLDPIYVDWYGMSKQIKDVTYPARTCVKFNPKDPVVVTGNVEGKISVYRLQDYESRKWFN